MPAGDLKRASALFFASIRQNFAYPATGMIWTLVDTLNALVMPAVWIAAGPQSAGFASKSEIVTYYIAAAGFSQFITCHYMWDIGWEIREGGIAGHLLKPPGYLLNCYARNLSFRVSKTVVFLPTLLLYFYCYQSYSLVPVSLGLNFWLAVVLGHLVSFIFAYCLALIAFWTTEFASIYEVYYLPEWALSGRLFPTHALPGWLGGLSAILPFQYTVAFPLQIAFQKIGPDAISRGLAMQLAWLILGFVLSHQLFKRGTKIYSGFGT